MQTDYSFLTRNPVRGFSLAELLLVLLIMGIITTFTIPKIMTSQTNATKKAVFKETYAAVYNVLYLGKLTGELRPATFDSQMFTRLSAIKQCTVGGSIANCYSPESNFTLRGLTLANGAAIYWQTNCCDNGGGDWSITALYMDYNGSQGPNVEGIDVVRMVASYGTATANYCSTNYLPGRLQPAPFCLDSVDYEGLFGDMFK